MLTKSSPASTLWQQVIHRFRRCSMFLQGYNDTRYCDLQKCMFSTGPPHGRLHCGHSTIQKKVPRTIHATVYSSVKTVSSTQKRSLPTIKNYEALAHSISSYCVARLMMHSASCPFLQASANSKCQRHIDTTDVITLVFRSPRGCPYQHHPQPIWLR